MASVWLRPALLVGLALVAVRPLPLGAQQPTTAQAEQLLQSRPDLVTKLQAKIGASGLTPDQVRARLRAMGYPENILDAYLPGSTTPVDSTMSTDTVFGAVRQLGLADSSELAAMRGQPPVMMPNAPGYGYPGYPPCGTYPSVPCPQPGVAGAPGQPALPLAAPDTGLQIFGLALFQHPTSQFDANLSGPVDPSYRLGPGDQLVLILTGDVEASYSLEVTREGFVVIPQVGQLYVANLTLDELNDLLYTRLGRVYSGVRRGGGSTKFHVSVAQLRSNQVFVVGDVAVPGSYRVSSAGTVLNALYAAGGPTVNGSMRRIEVRRAGKLVDTLDLYDYLLHGDASHDARLETGDVVFVPVHGPRVKATGEVVRPAIYELKADETLPDLLKAAGGFTATAARRRVQIARILPPGQRQPGGRDRVVIDLASDQFATGYGPAFPMAPGDSVRVFPVADRVRDRVTVLGDVWAPGSVGYTGGMTLSDAIKLAGGVKPDVYEGQVLVSRLQPDSTRVMLRGRFKDSTGAVMHDFPLHEDDEVQVFSTSEFRPDRYVAISGAVRNPGQYPYRVGMTMRDLVLLAGGVKESAYLQQAEIARLPESRDGGRTAETFKVPLDSSYLFERDGAGAGVYLGPPGLPAGTGRAPEVELRPYDNVLILRQPDWELQSTVTLHGEVKFPGRYTLTSKSERLSDLIRRAGGLTPEAYADGIVFYRNERHIGRVGIDLPDVLRDPKSADNLILMDGDSITVPEYSPVVRVEGAVNSPVGVAYVRGADLTYYVRAAGGPTRTADEGRAYVRQPNGQVEAMKRRRLLPDGVPEPRAGAVVYVPEKDPNDRKDYTAMAGAVAQILASTVAIVAIVLRK